MQPLFDVLRGDTVLVKNITFTDNSGEKIDLREKYIAARVSDIDECGLIHEIDNITHPESFFVDPVCYYKLQFSPPRDFTMSVGEYKLEFEIATLATMTGISVDPDTVELGPEETYDLGDVVVTVHFDVISDLEVDPASYEITSGDGSITDGIFTSPAIAGDTVITFTYTEGDSSETADLTITTVVPEP